MLIECTEQAGITTRTQAKAKPFPLSRIRLLRGPFKLKQEIHAQYLLMVEHDRLLAPFLMQAGLKPMAARYGGWESRDISGHSLGHYLSAIAIQYAGSMDLQFLTRIKYIVNELALCQRSNGDGYVLPVSKDAFLALAEGKIEATPFSLNGVWVPYYTLHKLMAGLRDAYRLAGVTQALMVERRLGEWLCQTLSRLTDSQIQQMLQTEHGGMNEVLADLSEDTGADQFLNLAANGFHHRVVLDPMLRGEDRLNGLHGNTQIPKVVGLAREYELTGRASYRRAAESFWCHVVKQRSYANGGHGESEHFFPLEKFPQHLTPNTCETCNTYNMLKLTGHLFAWEPKAEQMDFVERAMINHLLANIGEKPGEFGYFLGLGSVGVKVFSKPFDSWWCCVGTGMENPARYGEQIYYHSEDSLWVNLYLGSTLKWEEKGISLSQTTVFPDEETVRFAFECDRPARFTLKLRHPYWCCKPVVLINGLKESVNSVPSSYIEIERTWKSGDTIELQLPMSLRLEPLPHSENQIQALMYGPCLMAATIEPESGKPDPAKERFSNHLSARGKTDEFPPVWVTDHPEEILTHFSPTGRFFGEFISKDLMQPTESVFKPFHQIYEEHYAVYFPVLTSQAWLQREDGMRRERELQRAQAAATVDSVTPGYQQPEVEHQLRSENSEIEEFDNRKGRMAQNGGWFSYVLDVAPRESQYLTVTYWGGVWHERSFEIRVDGELLALQKLHNDRTGDFFEVSYPLSPHLLKEKKQITVGFYSRPADIAGGVFGLRLMRAMDER